MNERNVFDYAKFKRVSVCFEDINTEINHSLETRKQILRYSKTKLEKNMKQRKLLWIFSNNLRVFIHVINNGVVQVRELVSIDIVVSYFISALFCVNVKYKYKKTQTFKDIQ